MSNVWVAPTVSAVAALVGLYLGSRGERRRWLRDVRREAYLDFSRAIYAIQRASTPDDRTNAAEAMNLSLTAISFVGSVPVVEASDKVSPILRSQPVDLFKLSKAYNDFVRAASVTLTRGTWYSIRAWLERGPSDDDLRAHVAATYPLAPPDDETTPNGPPS